MGSTLDTRPTVSSKDVFRTRWRLDVGRFSAGRSMTREMFVVHVGIFMHNDMFDVPLTIMSLWFCSFASPYSNWTNLLILSCSDNRLVALPESLCGVSPLTHSCLEVIANILDRYPGMPPPHYDFLIKVFSVPLCFYLAHQTLIYLSPYFSASSS